MAEAMDFDEELTELVQKYQGDVKPEYIELILQKHSQSIRVEVGDTDRRHC